MPPPHPAGLPVLDPERLMELEKFLDQNLTSIAAEFLKNCDQAIEAMAVAVAADDPVQVRRIAHQMLGASQSLGMLQLAATFARVADDSPQADRLDDAWFESTRCLLEAAREAVAGRASRSGPAGASGA